MVVGKSSSRVNEDMGRVPIWKLPDLAHEIGNWTHTIWVRKERKGRKIMGREEDARRMVLVTISKEGEHVQLFGLEDNWKRNLFMGTRIVWKHFLTKMINGVTAKTSDWGRTHCKPPFLVERKPIFQVPVGRGEWSPSLVIAEKKEESLSEHHDRAKGWPVVNSSKSCCAYGWVEKGTPFSICNTIWFLDKYILLNLYSV